MALVRIVLDVIGGILVLDGLLIVGLIAWYRLERWRSARRVRRPGYITRSWRP